MSNVHTNNPSSTRLEAPTWPPARAIQPRYQTLADEINAVLEGRGVALNEGRTVNIGKSHGLAKFDCALRRRHWRRTVRTAGIKRPTPLRPAKARPGTGSPRN